MTKRKTCNVTTYVELSGDWKQRVSNEVIEALESDALKIKVEQHTHKTGSNKGYGCIKILETHNRKKDNA